ncbi:MAG: ATP synthase subunit I [Limnohabitans sp.]
MTKTQATSGSKNPALSPEVDAPNAVESQPWSAQQAQAWRQSQPHLSVWWVLAAQVLVAVFLASAFALWFASGALWLSWVYGAMTVVVPAALFARGLRSRTSSMHALGAALGLMVWQSVKWMLSVLFLVMAPRIVPELSWPALLAGLIVTLKVYWLALVWGKTTSSDMPSTRL